MDAHPLGGRVSWGVLVALTMLGIGGTVDAAPRKRAGADRAAPPATKLILGDKLARLFRTDHEEAKLQAIADLARFQRTVPDLPASLWGAIQAGVAAHKSGPGLHAAIILYGQVDDPEITPRLVSLVKGADAGIALSAAEGLANHQDVAALPAIVALRDRSEYETSYGYRHILLAIVATFHDPGTIDYLLSVLATSQGQLEYEAARMLTRLTAQNFGNDSERWRAWWKENRDDFAQRGPVELPQDQHLEVEMPWSRPVPRFFDLPIHAYRVVFVIDHSRSMQSSVDRVTRIEEVRREFEKAIRALPEPTLFGVVAYDSSVRLWRKQLVPATVQNRSDALRFAYSLNADNRTATYDALDAALAIDSNLESVVFLSDGDPNAGQIANPTRIIQEITHRNRLQRTAINVLAVDAEGPSEVFLKRLAAENFGNYLPIR